MMASVRDPKDIVRRGYDLVSWAYRPDDADDGRYGAWLDLLEERVVPGSPVLDLGCGCGIPVARRLAQRYAVTGVDFSEVQTARARELVAGANFVCADMTTVTFPEDSPTPGALCSDPRTNRYRDDRPLFALHTRSRYASADPMRLRREAPTYRGPKLFRLIRLGHEIVAAGRHRLCPVSGTACGNRNDRQGAQCFVTAELAHDLETAETREVEVEQQQLGLLASGESESVHAVGSRQHGVTHAFGHTLG